MNNKLNYLINTLTFFFLHMSSNSHLISKAQQAMEYLT
jgi:hypothetical protein